MRIDSIASLYEAQIQQGAGSRVRQGEAVSGGAKKGRDSFEMSPSGRSFSASLQAMLSTPDIRENVVADIRARIEDGTYAVDAFQIADKILG